MILCFFGESVDGCLLFCTLTNDKSSSSPIKASPNVDFKDRDTKDSLASGEVLFIFICIIEMRIPQISRTREYEIKT